MAKIACDCLSKDAKELVERSNLDIDLKKQLLGSRTCGEIRESELFAILTDPGVRKYSGTLKMIIPEIMKHGLTKAEVDSKLLALSEAGKIHLEVGTPIGVHGPELDAITINTPFARYAYAKATNKLESKRFF